MINVVYGGSPFAALTNLFPELVPWQMGSRVPQGFWQGAPGREHAQAATRWLLEQVGLAQEPPPTIAALLDLGTFEQWGLGGMIHIVYGRSPFAALADLFPELVPWQMGNGVPQGFWRGEEGRHRAQTATRWLLEHLGLQDADLSQLMRVVRKAAFQKAGLGGMLQIVYRDSPGAALRDVVAGT